MAIKDSSFVYTADYSDVGLKEVSARIGFTYHREVLTTKNLPKVIEELSTSEFTSIDTETTGLEFDSCALVSVNFSLSVGTEIHSYVAFYDKDYIKLHFRGRENYLPDQVTILDLVARFLQVKYCAMHNRLFDQRVLLYATPCTSVTGTMDTLTSDPSSLPYDAYSFTNVYDTLDMFWFLDSNVKSGLGLKELGRKYLGIETSHFEEAVGLDILNSPPRNLLDYGALDTYMTLSLFRLLLPIFLKRYQVWLKLIPQFKTALYFMESQHQCIDLDCTKELQVHVSAEIEELKERFYSDYGYVNLGSSVEKSRLLFRLGYVTSKMMKPRPDGEQVMSTAAKELEALSAQGCEPAGLMVRYNKLTKFLGTYIEPVISFLEPLDDGSTRPVRFHFIENRVPTARLGSGKYSIGRKPYLYFLPMNLQAITKPHTSLHGLDFDSETLEIKLYSDPRKGEYCVETGDESKNLRSIFSAPPGYKVVKADYSSEEVVIMANQSHEPVWIKAISSGADIHTETARSVFKIPSDQRVDKNLRKKAKSATFGLGFSLPGSYFPLVSMSGMPEQEARELEESYRAGLPTLYAWKNRVYQMAKIQGYVRNSFGHERRLRAYLNSKSRRNRDYGLKTALSHLVQGEAGSIMRIALVKLYKLIYGPDRKYNKAGVFNYASHQEVNPDVWFLDSVHDEICLVVRNDLVPEVALALSKLMASCTPPNSTLPLQADPEIGDNLGRTFPVEVVEVDGKLKVIPVSEERPVPKSEPTPQEATELTFSSDFQELDSLGGMEF